MPQPHPFLDGQTKRLLIDGQWTPAVNAACFPAINPATGETLAELACADAQDVDRAVAAARRALLGPWRRTPPADRQNLLLRLAALVEAHAEELALLDTLDMGAPIRHTRGAMPLLIATLRFYAGQALSLTGDTIPNSTGQDITSITLREPVGVVGAIVPWNGPIWALVWKIGPVLATGCTLVLKASEEAGLTALRFGELVQQAGAPAGVVNILTGLPEAGAALAAHPGVDKVSFTGSVETGRKIVAASAFTLKRLSLELGGKSPNIIFPDADLPRAISTATMAGFANCGQICTAGSRLFVHRTVLDQVTEQVSRATARLRLGNGADPDTDLGPLASARQMARVRHYIALGQTEGAELLAGGTRPDDAALSRGQFLTPAIFTGVRDDMTIAREEIFGPVLAILPFDEEEEVFGRANATGFGLGAALWTRDVGRALRGMRALRAGSVWLNCYNVLDPAVPCGGVGLSGYGRENGRAQLDDYLAIKTVWLGA
jgi:aldehyde dehydrogenase (NAD+)